MRFALAISAVTLRHMPTTPPDYASQHSRMRSNRKVLSASRRWQWATTYTIPCTFSTRRGVITRGFGHCHPCSYTIVIVHRSAIAVVNISKPGGGSTVQTWASANVSGCDTRITSAMVLTVGVCRSMARNTSFTSRASDSARCSALLATLSLIATCSKRWFGHVG